MPFKKNWYCILLLLGLVITTLKDNANANFSPAKPSRQIRGKVADRLQRAQNTSFPKIISAISVTEKLDDDFAKPLKDFIAPAFCGRPQDFWMRLSILTMVMP